MVSNPNYPDDNQLITRTDIDRREHNKDDFAKRVDIVKGSVSIIDPDTGDIVDVVDCGSKKALLVKTCTADIAQEQILVHDTDSLSRGSSATVLTYTVPAGKTFFLTEVIYGGEADGLFNVKVDGSDITVMRNSRNKRTDSLSFSKPVELTAAQVLDVRIENIDTAPVSGACDFEVTINGYNI